MASLNTLRTKYGVILSVVIILALLAFIISLGPEMGLGNNDPKVGVINGDKISYSEYLSEYETVKTYNGASEATEEEAAALSNATWQALIAKHLLLPDFEKMGLAVSEAERMALISGEIPTQVLYSAFADSQTGEYNVSNISAFLTQMASDPQAQAMWSYMNSQATLERLVGKFAGLVKAGTFANALEVKQGMVAANESRNGRIVALPYDTIADSLVTVSQAEIQKYYDDHKKLFKKLPQRALTYTVFEVAPTSEDMEAVEQKAKTLGEEMAAAEDVRAFVRKNMGVIADSYMSASQLAEDEAVMLEGKQYGPVLKGNEWVMSRVIDTKVAPDSLGLSHIVLTVEENDLADSLYNAIKGGADFANVAMTYSAYGASAQNGGDLGVMPFSGLTTELAEHLAGAKKGDILKVNVGNAIQILKVNRADAAKKHVLVATVNVPVEASSATRRDVHNVASVFSVDGKGSLDNFNAAASTAAVTPRIARLTQGDRLISGLENSREVARWAYGAKVGEISEIFNLGDAYVVAMLTEINNDEYVPVDQVSYDISLNLAADKKFAMLKDKLAGSSIDEVAKNAGVEVKSFENLKMNDPGIPSVSETFIVEPGVVGAIASTEQGKLSSPVKGYSAAVVFVVDAVNKEEAQTAEAERVRLQSTNEMVASQAAIAALDQVTEIEDLRGQYF